MNDCIQIYKEGKAPHARQSSLYTVILNPNPQPLPGRTIYM